MRIPPLLLCLSQILNEICVSAANLLGNLGIACTFEMFLTLGLAFAVPISAIVDIYRHEVVFQGMKLAGILLILLGFMLVQLPDDWPDYLTMLLRYR